MTPAARASAAIEVLADIDQRKRPASEALKDWGLGHRFAGSGDRAAIGNLVFDCLRKRASAAYAMGEDSPRALVLRTLVTDWGMTPDQVATLCDGSRFAPAPLDAASAKGWPARFPTMRLPPCAATIRNGSRPPSPTPSGTARRRRGRRCRHARRSICG